MQISFYSLLIDIFYPSLRYLAPDFFASCALRIADIAKPGDKIPDLPKDAGMESIEVLDFIPKETDPQLKFDLKCKRLCKKMLLLTEPLKFLRKEKKK